MSAANDNALAYVGTYTSGKSKGIYAVGLDIKTGRLGKPELAAELENPSYLALSKDRKYLYTVLETDIYEGNTGGAAGAFAIDYPSGELRLLNIQPTNGRSPCHISTDNLNKYLFAANYSDGTVTAYSLNSDGSIGSILSQVCHKGSGPDPIRQESPHAHYAVLTPDEKFLCAVDLGIDSIMMYRFNREKGSLLPAKNHTVRIRPGSGPRHIEFHPDGRFVYLINELSSDIVVMEYLSGFFRQCQTISALPEGFAGASSGAAIHISPDGKYLYTSNRGHDSIAVFKIDRTSGTLEFISHTSTYGEFPRDFAIHPTGKYLLAANQHSGTIVPFSVEEGSGKLEQAGDPVYIPKPVCVKFN